MGLPTQRMFLNGSSALLSCSLLPPSHLYPASFWGVPLGIYPLVRTDLSFVDLSFGQGQLSSSWEA